MDCIEREFTEERERWDFNYKDYSAVISTVAKTVAVINRVTWKTRQATNKNVFSKSRPHEWVLHHITTWKIGSMRKLVKTLEQLCFDFGIPRITNQTSQKNLAYSNDSGDFQKVTHCSLETKVKKIPENLTLCCWCCYCAGSFWIIWGATGKAWKAGWGCTLEAAGLSAKAEFVDVIGVQVNVDEEQHSGQLIHKGTLACNAAQQLH